MAAMIGDWSPTSPVELRELWLKGPRLFRYQGQAVCPAKFHVGSVGFAASRVRTPRAGEGLSK
jgi:hypothetical protein